MSETSNARQPKKITLIIVILVIILLLVYGGGGIALPRSILSSYQSKNCESVLSWHRLYATLYPAFIEEQSLSNSVMECAVYRLANAEEQKEAWASSYNAYQVYESRYSDGLLVDDAHQQAAFVLTNLAKQQISEGRFTEALTNLNLILANYKDTDSSQVALDLFPQLYTAWGEELRKAGRFEEALAVYGELQHWVDNNTQGGEYSKLARLGIAQTYLDWGIQLQSQKNFGEAEGKFESAKSADPTLIEQIRANEEKFHAEWGDFLVAQSDFAGAMEQYRVSAQLVEARDSIAANALITNGYIQWAGGLSTQEDFVGALVVLDYVEETAATDSARESIEAARTNTYAAFSSSTGEQAQKAVGDAVALVCKHHTNPRLPIFGTDQENVLVGLYGIDGNLPSETAASVPSSLHYVICVEETINVVGSTTHTLFASSAGFRPYLFERLRYSWTVTLRKADTGEETATTIIEGPEPAPFPTTDQEIYTAAFIGSTQYFGEKPDFTEVVDWIAEVLN